MRSRNPPFRGKRASTLTVTSTIEAPGIPPSVGVSATMGEWTPEIRRPAETLVLATVAGSAVLLGASQRRRSVVAAGAALGALPSIRLAARQYRVDNSRFFRRVASVSAGLAFDSVQLSTSLNARDIGIGVFVVQRRLLPPRRRYLGRVAEARVVQLTSPTGITWARGKGALGLAWERGRPVAFDLAGTWADPSLWESSTGPNAPTMGLTRSEIERLVNRYSAVLAVPIHSSAEVVAVVSLDTRADASSEWVHDVSTLEVCTRALLEAGARVAASLRAVPPFVYPGRTQWRRR